MDDTKPKMFDHVEDYKLDMKVTQINHHIVNFFMGDFYRLKFGKIKFEVDIMCITLLLID